MIVGFGFAPCLVYVARLVLCVTRYRCFVGFNVIGALIMYLGVWVCICVD